MRAFAGLAIALVFWTVCYGQAPVVIQTPLGSIKGVQGTNYQVFKGLQYATAKRWQSPVVQRQAWAGVFDATQYGACCPQVGYWGTAASEDCLHLNVWTPQATTGKNYPVMVWIHGGTFLDGCSADEMFDGSFLANSTGTVLVTINYRMGALGFLSGSGFKGNYGIQDQVAALTWVQSYVHAFGGNPHQVTVFGQSAGAMSVALLLANPIVRSSALISGAILESDPFAMILRTPPQQEYYAELFTSLVGCPLNDTQCLLSKSMPDIIAVQLLDLTINFPPHLVDILSVLPWIPTVDGVTVPDQMMGSLKSGNFIRVPVMLGSAANESYCAMKAPLTALNMSDYTEWEYYGFLAGAFSPHDVDIVYGHYPPKPTVVSAMSMVIADLVFKCSTRYAAQQITKHGGVAYLYNWNYERFWVSENGQNQAIAAACHDVELPFVFRSFSFVNDPTIPTDLSISSYVMKTWATFAAGQAPFTAFNNVTFPSLVVVSPTPRVENYFNQERCEFWEAFVYQSLFPK